ncbi:MAG TPA: hypothetical protein VMK83_03815 [Gaiellaceae bacterium]|nr:hypothetical protein [Gaiellaceae bacterium]
MPPQPTSPPPTNIPWGSLSPRSLAIVREVGLRLTAGYSFTEVAAILDHERPEIPDAPISARGITKGWVQTRLREARTEIREIASS